MKTSRIQQKGAFAAPSVVTIPSVQFTYTKAERTFVAEESSLRTYFGALGLHATFRMSSVKTGAVVTFGFSHYIRQDGEIVSTVYTTQLTAVEPLQPTVRLVDLLGVSVHILND